MIQRRTQILVTILMTSSFAMLAAMTAYAKGNKPEATPTPYPYCDWDQATDESAKVFLSARVVPNGKVKILKQDKPITFFGGTDTAKISTNCSVRLRNTDKTKKTREISKDREFSVVDFSVRLNNIDDGDVYDRNLSIWADSSEKGVQMIDCVMERKDIRMHENLSQVKTLADFRKKYNDFRESQKQWLELPELIDPPGSCVKPEEVRRPSAKQREEAIATGQRVKSVPRSSRGHSSKPETGNSDTRVD